MRLSRGPFLILHTLALIVILVKGRVREVDALIQKPKALKPGPLPATWTRNTNTNINSNSNSNHQRITNTNRIAQNYNNNNNARQHERSEKSMRVKMAGNMPAFQSENKVLKRRLLFATALAGVLYLKPKGLLLFLSNGLYKPYQNSLVTNPLVTKVVTGAILSIIGDGVAQASSSDEIPYDKRRALSFAVFDSCYRVFQHNMFPAIIRAGKGNVVGKLLPMLAPAAAAIEQTAMYQFLVVPVSSLKNEAEQYNTIQYFSRRWM